MADICLKIDSISLSPITKGAISGAAITASELWSTKPAMLLVTRRPGWVICREEALTLSSRHKAGEFGDVGLFSIIKEIAPISGAATDEILGVGEYQSKYFLDYPVYLDERRLFYSAFGNKSLIAQLTAGSWNPFTLYSDYTALSKRLKSQKIEGNLKGEGLIKGGLLIVKTDRTVHYLHSEQTGSLLPFDEIKAATAAL